MIKPSHNPITNEHLGELIHAPLTMYCPDLKRLSSSKSNKITILINIACVVFHADHFMQ